MQTPVEEQILTHLEEQQGVEPVVVQAQVPEQVRVVVEQAQAVVVQAQVPDPVLAALAVVPVEAEQVQVDLEQVAEPEPEQVLVQEVVDQPRQAADFKR
jgi:hypothetical protein